MANPAAAYASTRDGKPININDQATLAAFVTGISGSGPSAVITVQMQGSNLILNVQAQDVAATTQTL